MFINRVRELAFLERRYASIQAELVVLYGRRRVGKTEMLRRFCEGKRHFFFVADLGTEAEYILLGECRWRPRPIGTDTLVELKDKAVRIPGTRHQVLALFSRSGFTESLQAEAASQGVFLFGLEDVL